MADFGFKIEKKSAGSLARVGIIETPHGRIETPAFIPVATKATVKALSPEQTAGIGAQAVLANTYHLYLQPGADIVAAAGGFARFMNWKGPTFTDSGGFQVFSLGAAFGRRQSKVKSKGADEEVSGQVEANGEKPLAKVDEDGVTFRSHIDGSEHRFTPETSMDIQRALGADIIFAFDECPSPTATESYQREAMDRTHRWARRSFDAHRKLEKDAAAKGQSAQALFGIVQGGRHESLRRESAKAIGATEFAGFGIGGSFDKEDMGNAVRWVNEELPEDKPRHLLGIGDPLDLFSAVENGSDTFDCVAPTRMGRTGTLYTENGRINIRNAAYARDFAPIETACDCYACRNYSRAYLSHLFRSEEMLAGTLASIHNLRFIVRIVENMRKAILDGTFERYRGEFAGAYLSRA